jgi:glycosyltransferase involved in cell wall biosynthesis
MPTSDAAAQRIRVLRIFHAGRNAANRARDRSLLNEGVDVIYAVPRVWPENGGEKILSSESFPIVELDVRSPGNVNRHSYRDVAAVSNLATIHDVDLVDLFEEPFSRAAGQLLPLLPPDLPVVMYSAQNLDKRWPPPFRTYERRSLQRVQAFYPCSRQAASVLRGKGYGGLIRPLPLGYDEGTFLPGEQTLSGGKLQMAVVGRMVPEKGISDAVRVVAALRGHHAIDASLVLAGSGPALAEVLDLADKLKVGDAVQNRPWLPPADLAELYQATHIVLTPSRSTATWVEQFGRMIVEAQASGCAVVGYASGSIPEVGGEPALLVPEGELDALTAAVLQAAGDEDAFQARRHAGLALAADRTWSKVAHCQANLYRSALYLPRPSLRAGSSRQRRQAAVAEFGQTAQALGQSRPFAVPGLRESNAATRTLGRAMDMLAEVGVKSRSAV